MAELFAEPAVNQANLADWQRLIEKTTFEAGGFMALGLTNMDNVLEAQIAQGSRVEVGGSLYVCEADEKVTGTPSAGVTYIYCSTSGSTASFSYASTPPTWSAIKGGWYNGNNRAVALFYLNSGSYLGKRTLGDSRDDLIPTDVGEGTIGGALVASTSGTQKKDVTLKKGFYRIELAGSKGGNGGAGDSPGGNGARGGYLNMTLYINRTVTATIFSAKKGDDGGNGGYSDGSSDPDGRVGGGGGGGGGTAGFICIALFIGLFVFGGGGGGGGGSNDTGSNHSDDNGGSGGGGGGGSGSDGKEGKPFSISYTVPGTGDEDPGYTVSGKAGEGGDGGSGGVKGKGGNGGQAGRVDDPIDRPEGGLGYGSEYIYPSVFWGRGGDGGKGGKGEDAYGTAAEVGSDGNTGGNSINGDVGNAPSDDGFVMIYRVA